MTAITSTFFDQLVSHGLLIPGGVDGLPGRSGVFESVVTALDRLIDGFVAPYEAEVMRFPPGMSRRTFEESEYLKNFPQFAGTVHCFCGDDRAHRKLLQCVADGDDWTADQPGTDIVLTPAACYPVYPALARRGAIPASGWAVDVSSFCFRHEPSIEPTRMQMFRQREIVRVGTPEQVLAFREDWKSRVPAFVAALGLPHEIDLANDPFFGRTGKFVADSQREQQLKYELLIQVNNGAGPTACGSMNYHLDHFGAIWRLAGSDGAVAHTGCCAFGMERMTLALFRHHGMVPSRWPDDVRQLMWPERG